MKHLKLNPPVIITVEGGVIQSINNIPPGIVIQVRDFDTEGCHGTAMRYNDTGEAYIVSEWRNNDGVR